MISLINIMKGRNLINALGIPCWLFLIWKGGLYYTIFMLVCCVLALGEFYSIMEKKGAHPLRWFGMGSTVFIADYYYVQLGRSTLDAVQRDCYRYLRRPCKRVSARVV